MLERKPLVSKRKRQEQGFINKLLFFQSVYETTAVSLQIKKTEFTFVNEYFFIKNNAVIEVFLQTLNITLAEM